MLLLSMKNIITLCYQKKLRIDGKNYKKLKSVKKIIILLILFKIYTHNITCNNKLIAMDLNRKKLLNVQTIKSGQ